MSAAIAVLAFTPLAHAQDPYTRNLGARLKSAGYVRFAPVPWADGQDSAAIEAELGDIGLRWVETAHFRIGSALAPWTVPAREKKTRAKIRDELTRLRKRIPSVRVNAKRLGAWLRLHLFAQRLEELYRDFAARLGTSDLALRDKLAVLLLENGADLERYTRTFVGRDSDTAQRFVSPSTGTPVFVTAARIHPGCYVHDTALNCHVVFGVVHNLVNCYRGNYYQVPVWWQEGLAQWYAKRVAPEWSNFTAAKDFPDDISRFADWNLLAHQIARTGDFRPAKEMTSWLDYSRFTFRDQIVAWSRVDWLMSRGRGGFATFMNGIKGQRDQRRGLPIYGSAVLGAQTRALAQAWNIQDISELDRSWRTWVLRSTKRRTR